MAEHMYEGSTRERGEDTEQKERISRRRPWTAEDGWLNIGDHPGHGNHTINLRDQRLAEIIAEQHNRVLEESVLKQYHVRFGSTVGSAPRPGEAMTPAERISWPPFTHGRIVCKTCGAVVAQCRCPKGCEVVGTVPECSKCKPKEA